MGMEFAKGNIGRSCAGVIPKSLFNITTTLANTHTLSQLRPHCSSHRPRWITASALAPPAAAHRRARESARGLRCTATLEEGGPLSLLPRPPPPGPTFSLGPKGRAHQKQRRTAAIAPQKVTIPQNRGTSRSPPFFFQESVPDHCPQKKSKVWSFERVSKPPYPHFPGFANETCKSSTANQ